MDGLVEIHTAHCLNENIQTASFRYSRQFSGKFAFPAVKTGNEFSVNVNLPPVVQFGDGQCRPRMDILIDLGPVQYGSPALVKLLYRSDFPGLLRARKIVEKWRHFTEAEFRNTYNRQRGRDLRH